MNRVDRIKGRSIGILGMARSGVAAATLARRLGGKPFVSDLADSNSLTDQIVQLKKQQIAFETGGHTERLLASDYLVLSPGVPLNIEILKQADAKGIPVFSEIEFASWVCRAKMIAITGSNGKTTTVTLLGKILEGAGLNVAICGNIGRPFSEVVDQLDEDGIAVIEISTFQLETIDDFSPDVAVILNLTEDHLDRHGSFENYRNLKYRISENQTSEKSLILNVDDPRLNEQPIKTEADVRYFSTRDIDSALTRVKDGCLWVRQQSGFKRVIECDRIRIPGPHNLQNAAAAAAVASRFSVSTQIIEQVLTEFEGVEHRLESLKAVAGIDFVNDSKATNIDSMIMAIRSISGSLYLIVGGRYKGGEFSQVAQFADRIRGIIAMGEAKQLVFSALGSSIAVQFADRMDEAVRMAFEMAHPGETILLSPGCASFDMFENYEERGQAFKRAVLALKNNRKENETISH